MSRRSTLADLLKQDASSSTGPAPEMLQPVASGALRAMSLSLERMSSEADEARGLKSKIAAGDHVVNLDPKLIDASFIADRIPVEDDNDFEAFVKTISEQGQQVPILVRPNPSDPGRYQVAYGRRRIGAAAHLQIPVRAIVKVLTDEELVIAQAKENLDRKDLSYIERALFARQLEERQFDRVMIMGALGVDKGDLSRLLAVAHGVPADLVLAIGPAPRIGRPRWVQLAELIKSAVGRRRAMAAVAEEGFRSADTNRRFGIVIGRLQQKDVSASGDNEMVKSTSGRVLAQLEETPRRARIVIEDGGFRAFLLSRLPSLVSEFEAETVVKG
jgi:ParB family transcriptional regulator, chromosome partitioning protein